MSHTADELSPRFNLIERAIAIMLVTATTGLAILGLNARMNGRLISIIDEFWARWDWAVLALGLGIGGPLFVIWCIHQAGITHNKRRQARR